MKTLVVSGVLYDANGSSFKFSKSPQTTMSGHGSEASVTI